MLLNGRDLNLAVYGPGGRLEGQDPFSQAPKINQGVGVQNPSALTITFSGFSGFSPSAIASIVVRGVFNASFNVYVSDNGGAFTKEASNQLGPNGPQNPAVYNSPGNKVIGHTYAYYVSTVINGVEGIASNQVSGVPTQ